MWHRDGSRPASLTLTPLCSLCSVRRMQLSDRVAASAGSACHSNVAEMSGVLKAMRVQKSVGLGTIRLSVGRYVLEGGYEMLAARSAKDVVTGYALNVATESRSICVERDLGCVSIVVPPMRRIPLLSSQGARSALLWWPCPKARRSGRAAGRPFREPAP